MIVDVLFRIEAESSLFAFGDAVVFAFHFFSPIRYEDTSPLRFFTISVLKYSVDGNISGRIGVWDAFKALEVAVKLTVVVITPVIAEVGSA